MAHSIYDPRLPVVSLEEQAEIKNRYFQAKLQEAKEKQLAAGLPARSVEQRIDALRKGNLIRSKRALLKKEIKDGNEHISVLLLYPPNYIETMKVYDLIMSVPKYGKVKTNKILRICQISPSKTVKGLSNRQRSDLSLILK